MSYLHDLVLADRFVVTTEADAMAPKTIKSTFGFMVGDIVTSENPDCDYCNKVVEVYQCDADKLLVHAINNSNGWVKDSGEGAITQPNGLLLLQRPSYVFRVGDEVVFYNKKMPVSLSGKVVAIDPNPTGRPFAFQFNATTNIVSIPHLESAVWTPEALVRADGNLRYLWAASSDLRMLPGFVRTEFSFEPVSQTAEPTNSSYVLPAWFTAMYNNWRSQTAHSFVLHGNIGDIIPNDSGRYVSLSAYFMSLFSHFQYLMFYSLGEGLTFATEEMSNDFRQTYLTSGTPAATTGARAQLVQQAQDKRSIAQIIGKSTTDVFDLLTDVFHNVKEPDNLEPTHQKTNRKVLIIDFAHDIFFPSQSPTINDRVNIEMIIRWARDNQIRENGHLIIMLTPNLINIHSDLRANDSGIVFARIPKPNEGERLLTWQKAIADHRIEAEAGVTPEILARITNGLSRRQIENAAKMSQALGHELSLEIVRQLKEEILQKEFGDRLKIKVPKKGFENFGGKAKLKKYFRDIISNLIGGVRRRVPMGILIPGPPGTGKTCFLECFAKESGFTVVELGNMRNMFVGESERIAEEVFAALDDLAPVIVIEDEADQSETTRGSYQGDSGVSNRIRQLKFTFCSDPERRGKVLWFRLTNRADLLDAAYKRKGRSDEIVPFVMPEADDYADIFRVMFARYEIPTDITDFTPFAELAASMNYVTGGDIEWMVLESDKLAGAENNEKVEPDHLFQAITSWEMPLDPREVDEQTILAIEHSSKQLRPDNWPELLQQAQERLGLLGVGADVGSTAGSAIEPKKRRSDVHHG